MSWIKRNLYFVIGSVVALILMIVGGFFLFTQISDEAQVADDISKQYAELERLTGQNPNPGDDKINNIKIAKEQEAEIRAYIGKTHPFFTRILPIPDFSTNRITDKEFASQLRVTISQLHRTADQQSVIIPPEYYFTFQAQKKVMNFDPASLESLAVHLGEVKAISEVLFDAKINSLDSIRREVISPNDDNPPDYLPLKTVSTPLADLTPYEVTFRCFSAELALVMADFANSPYGFIVKTINVEPASPVGVADDNTANQMGTPTMPGGPGYAGAVPGGGVPGAPGVDPRTMGRHGAVQPVAPVAATVAAPVNTKGGQVFLTEKPFRVTLLVDVVKVRSGAK